jgi:cyclophilin family peptidyl-prolyl cis-trans isomerase
MLSGNVLATVAGSAVIVSGDSAANDVTLLHTDAGVVLRGMNGTTVNGSTDDAVLFAGQSQVKGSVIVHLGQGDDVFHISGVDVGHDLHISGEKGHDALFVQNATVSGSLIADLGSGDDLLSVENSSIAHNVVVMGTDGYDVLHINGGSVGHDVVFLGGKGNDALGVTSATVGGNVVFIGQSGDDSMYLENATLNRNAIADLGAGDDLVAVESSMLAGDLTVVAAKGSDQIAIDSSTVGRNFVAHLGRGQNDVRLSGATVNHNVSLYGGSDKDVVKIENSAIEHDLDMHLGHGKDSVWITGTSSIGHELEAYGGSGNDSLQIDSTVTQPDHKHTHSFESDTVNPVLLSVRMDDPTIGVTTAVQQARERQFGPAMFSVDLSGNAPVQSNGVMIVFDPMLSIAVTGTPGLTVQVDRDRNGAFDDGSVTLDQNGTGVIQTQLLHDSTNNGLNHLVIRGVENGVPISSAPEEFDVHYAVGTVARFDTELGSYDVELLNADAPNTVQNFLNYSDRYAGSIIHRSAHTTGGGDFVIQGGGFDLVPPLTPIQTDAPIQNEFNQANSNVRGTVAMALPGNNINGATSQWFVNVADNTFLDSGSFTVFGRVIGDGLTIVDAIHALPTFNVSGPLNNSALAEVPLQGYTPFTVQLQGTVDTTSGMTTVTGTGTQFTQGLITGAAVRIDGVAYTVASVNSDTQLTLTTAATTTSSSTMAFANAAPLDNQYVTLSSIAPIGGTP